MKKGSFKGGCGNLRFKTTSFNPTYYLFNLNLYILMFPLKMQVPDKSKGMKKYMVLFCIVLVSIVVSAVLAGYVGTKDVVDDIPSIVQAKVETMSGWGILETLLNQTEIETLVLNQGDMLIVAEY